MAPAGPKAGAFYAATDNGVFMAPMRVLNTDASLADLLVDGITVAQFDPEVYHYNLTLPHGTAEVPVVTAVAVDSNADLVITQADSVTGTATVVVTAEDGTTTQVYTITFSLEVILGDLNGDGIVDVGDAILILRYVVGLVEFTDEQQLAGDVNGDGSIDVGDAILVLRHIVGLIDIGAG